MKIKYLILAIFMAAAVSGVVSADNLTIEGSAADKISLYNDAIDLANEGEYEKSLILLDDAIGIDANFTIAYAAKAGILSVTGDYEGALSAADTATELNPEQADAWVNKATVLIALERYDEALAAADKAIVLEPDYFEAWLNKGTALGGLGRYEEELAASERALEIDPQNNLAWANKNYAKDMIEKESGKQQSPVSVIALICGVSVGILAVAAIKRQNKK